MSGTTIIAPGAPVLRSRLRGAFGVVGDLALAIAVVLALPLLLSLAVAIGQFVRFLVR